MQRPRLCEGMFKPIDVEQMYHIRLKPTLGAMGYRGRLWLYNNFNSIFFSMDHNHNMRANQPSIDVIAF